MTFRMSKTCCNIKATVNNISDPDLESFENSPHPTIEYPPLYFALKKCPSILKMLNGLYRIRWMLRYPFQRRLPMSKKLRKIGITATWADCLLMLPFIVILVQGVNSSFIDTSVVKSGQASRAPLIICFLTANHNSLLTLILGIPFERAIKYHKISGYVAFLNGIFHTFAAWEVHYRTEGQNSNIKSVLSGSTVNTSGTMILCTICSMLITAFPYVRRKAFEVFYYLHILFAMLMIGCAFYHSGVLVPVVASFLWGGDILMRKVYMAHYRYPRTASISQLTDTVVQVSFLKTAGFDYNPGQVRSD